MKCKKKYLKAFIRRIDVHIEESIATGSAFARPENSNNEVLEEWIVDSDDTRTFDW